MKKLIIALLLISAPAFAWDFEAIQRETLPPNGYLVQRPDLALELLRQLAFDYEMDFDRAAYYRKRMEFWGEMKMQLSPSDPWYNSVSSLYKLYSEFLSEHQETAIDRATRHMSR
ncbi:MAG: hypothetical protein HXX19_18765 [Rhodoferax sp.]|nr:hypothetical protein [Rhodoferax sp.]